MNSVVTGDDAGVVHRLAERDDIVPLQCLAHVRTVDDRPGVLETGRGGHRGGDSAERLQRQVSGLVKQAANPLQSGNVPDLVGVHERPRGARRDDPAGEPGGGGHARLVVDVSIEEAGGEELPVSVYLLGVRAGIDRAGVGHAGDAPVGDDEASGFANLTGVNVDDAAVPDDGVGVRRRRVRRRRDAVTCPPVSRGRRQRGTVAYAVGGRIAQKGLSKGRPRGVSSHPGGPGQDSSAAMTFYCSRPNSGQ